ncbi:DNA topoisomerase family protein [Paraglaciecola arctica]|uniref:DNA topoisomerase family protein n=1 Tax=Paraglaciecola arctica TaxID=1128911 RepID=UPI001C066CF2|nr:topoisomerase DNA-binding C4 zinc finger domain-containing protein [Paraglaciecola arctica]MBU3003522.1 topoisomerase DNA-binding C4 zinc finger domain-containing protein [Paraglaciecola arctica]
MSKIDHSLFSASATEQAFGPCPQCNAKLTIRRGKSGAFIGCSHYPECDFSKPLHEYESPEIKIIEGSSCPKCQSLLVIKKGRFGLFIGCSDFPECDYIQSNSNSEDTKLTCPACKKGHITKRTNKFGKSFFACDNYPKCKYLLNFPPVAHPCPKCNWPIMQQKKGASEVELICPQKQCQCKIPKPQ